MALGFAAAVAWAAVCTLDGGMAMGNNPGTPGTLGAAAGLTAFAVLAAWGLWRCRGRVDRWGGAALAAAAAWAAWNAASVAWAVEPSLAWLAANRAVMLAAAIAVGVSLAAVGGARARAAFAPALAAAAAAPLAWAAASVVVPTVLGDASTARLNAPIGHPTVLALVAAMALPGALTGGAARAWRGRAMAVVAVLALACVPLTLSRGGLAAAGVAVAFTLWGTPRTRRAVARLAVGAVAAAPAVAYGLTAHALTTDNLPLEDRRAAGAVFGLLLLAGCALAARAAPAAEERVSRWEPRARGVRGACLAAALVMAVMPLGVLLTGSDVRDCRPTGIGGNVDRVTSLEGNQRGPWWCEAGRGWRLAPVAGNGAGSFPVIELRTRATGNGLVQTRDPHGMWPEAASALGTVGVALLALVWGLAGWALVRRRVPSALAAVPLAAFAQAQADWVMSWPAVAVPVGVAIGLIAGGPRAATRRRVAGEPARAAALAVGVVAVAAAAWLPYLAEHALVDGQDALYVRGDPGGAYRLASRAASLNPLAIEPAQLKGQALAAAGDRRGALNAFREATRVQPDNPASWQSLAQALPGDASASRAAWARVAELDPHSPALAARRGG